MSSYHDLDDPRNGRSSRGYERTRSRSPPRGVRDYNRDREYRDVGRGERRDDYYNRESRREPDRGGRGGRDGYGGGRESYGRGRYEDERNDRGRYEDERNRYDDERARDRDSGSGRGDRDRRRGEHERTDRQGDRDSRRGREHSRSVSPDNVPVDANVSKDDETASGELTEEQIMQKMLGFGGFETTKNKKVAGTDVSAVNIEKKRTYRQYMNRRGGFNRNLSPTR